MTHPVKNPYHLVAVTGLPPLWGMTSAARLDKQFHLLRTPREAAAAFEIAVREDWVFDTPILRGLMVEAPIAVIDPVTGAPCAASVPPEMLAEAIAWLEGNGALPTGLRAVIPADLASAYDHKLRKRETPACHHLSAATVDDVERKLFRTSYKGVTDLVTKFAWPVPAFYATRWCARRHLSPNQVTVVSAVLVLACLWLFASGYFWVGMLAAWVMTFLDTVDGKLARVTLTSSWWGNVFDHGIDLIHPPFWYYAWGVGLALSPTPLGDGQFALLMWLIFGGYILGRLCEGYFTRRYGMHVHVWRRFDSRFRLFMARRNPNMILLQLSLFVARPDWGLIAVAVWTVASLGVQLVQVAQAEKLRRAGTPITSWLHGA